MFDPIGQHAADFFAAAQPDARRLFHGRGQLFPGLEHLSVDWYPPVVLITTYADITEPAPLCEAITAADQHSQVRCVLLQTRGRKGASTVCLHGEPIHQCTVTEDELRFEVQPGVNQNAGLFLDMRPLRGWLRQQATRKNVLNLFAYTCSLSVAALAGGARQVVNVDMSKPSIQWGERNHALNGQDLRQVRSIPHNLFRSWGRIRQFGRYDIIVIDPPTRQRGSFNAEKNYSAVLKKLGQLSADGADIVATVNSPYLGEDFLPQQFARYAPGCRFIDMLPASPEFRDKYPERALKIYHFRSA